jgi:hypothetical protein
LLVGEFGDAGGGSGRGPFGLEASLFGGVVLSRDLVLVRLTVVATSALDEGRHAGGDPNLVRLL